MVRLGHQQSNLFTDFFEELLGQHELELAGEDALHVGRSRVRPLKLLVFLGRNSIAGSMSAFKSETPVC